MSNSGKSEFPIFDNQPQLIYMDSAATALKPRSVLDKLDQYYTQYSANIHRGIYPMSERATDEYENARSKIAEFIGAKPERVIFTGGTTDSLNQIAQSYRDKLTADDEIVIPRSEHHANMLPWQRLSADTGAKLVMMVETDLTPDRITKYISAKTKIVSFAHVSNVFGVINDVAGISSAIHRINPEIVITVDGAQAVAHLKVDFDSLGANYYAFSGHKLYGPTGIGILAVSDRAFKDLLPLTVGGGAIRTVTEKNYELLSGPEGFEAGTPPIAQAIGLGAAVEFAETARNESKDLSDELYGKLKQLEFINILEQEGQRTPLVSFNVNGVHAHDTAQYLANNNIAVRAGHHCTMPLHTALDIPASVRASLAVYNTSEDIDKLVEALKACYTGLA